MFKKVIVTGATGYIGSNFVKYCVRKSIKVAIICRSSSKLDLLQDLLDCIEIFTYEEDIENLVCFMKRFTPDVVYHFATYYIAEHDSNNIMNMIHSNVTFGTVILQTMKEAGIKRFVNASTSWQNFNNKEYSPVSLYAASKEAFESILKYYVEVEGFDAISMRIFDSYGPNDPRNKIIHLFKRIARSGEVLEMSYGEQEIDLVYIDDIISDFMKAGVLLVSGQEHEEKYYIRSGNIRTLRETASIFEKVYETHLNIKWGAKPYRKREVMKVATIGEAIDEDAKRVTLEEGLRKIKKYEL